MSDKLLTDIRQQLGYDEDDDSHDEEILAMSPDEQFQLYCQFNGFLGGSWSRMRDAVLELYGCTDLIEPNFDRGSSYPRNNKGPFAPF